LSDLGRAEAVSAVIQALPGAKTSSRVDRIRRLHLDVREENNVGKPNLPVTRSSRKFNGAALPQGSAEVL